MLDLGNLKLANGTIGHQTGDCLLQIAGDQVSAAIRPGRTFRGGGDKFAVIIVATAALPDLERMAGTIFDAVSLPADCDGQFVVSRATIGGAVLSPGDPDVDRVRQNADLAFYHATEPGRGGLRALWPGLGATMERRLDGIREVSCASRRPSAASF